MHWGSGASRWQSSNYTGIWATAGTTCTYMHANVPTFMWRDRPDPVNRSSPHCNLWVEVPRFSWAWKVPSKSSVRGASACTYSFHFTKSSDLRVPPSHNDVLPPWPGWAVLTVGIESSVSQPSQSTLCKAIWCFDPSISLILQTSLLEGVWMISQRGLTHVAEEYILCRIWILTVPVHWNGGVLLFSYLCTCGRARSTSPRWQISEECQMISTPLVNDLTLKLLDVDSRQSLVTGKSVK